MKFMKIRVHVGDVPIVDKVTDLTTKYVFPDEERTDTVYIGDGTEEDLETLRKNGWRVEFLEFLEAKP
ncbi:MAG: hypothetical protein KBD17_00480 [Candidatus Pacebacteria bacterium]|nr:hypothetical protein [Candidatus Paceibacterota bacterium]